MQKIVQKKKSFAERKPLAPRMVRKADAAKMMEILCKEYPDAECELDYRSEFQLLISVILSAQTTDVQVNKVTPALFKKYPDAKSLSGADPEDVKALIKATGYYNAKTKSIIACASALEEKFSGKVPATREELMQLPGVGRKTANVVLGVLHDIPGWTVDTHVQRLARRLGFTKQEDPAKIEAELEKLFPHKDWSRYSITLIWHGRRRCYARKPDCLNCPINRLCPSSLLP